MTMDGLQFTVGLVGAGNMGGAMLGGWLDKGLAAKNVVVIDPSFPNPASMEFSAKGVRVLPGLDPQSSLAPVDVLMVAVKPQVMAAVLPQIKPLIGPQSVVVSVAAGKTLAFMAAHLGSGAHVRAMPNTPALIGKGATIAIANDAVTLQQKAQVAALLSANGLFDWVEDEALIDVVTAVSGSGPAYVFHLAECMSEAGIALGLDPQMAARLVRQTIAGAGAMLETRDETAEQLRVNVTSPGGTTAAALAILMKNDAMKALFKEAIAAACNRAKELS